MTDLQLSITRTAIDAIHAKASAVISRAPGCNLLDDVQQTVGDEVYIELIQRIIGDQHIKRQPPLIHAGYLLRIQAILSTICNFISIIADGSSDDDDKKINDATIILLGSGMDVTGLWAARMFPKVVGHVIEIDLPIVCASKRQILQQQGLVNFLNETVSTETSATKRQVTIHQGTLAATTQPQQHSSTTTLKQKFALLEADLRDQHDWKNVLEGVWNWQTSPTLVICEVVLAYLGGKDVVDTVLLGWATALQDNPESCMVLLEPVGPCSSSSSSSSSDDDTAADTTVASNKKNGVLHSYQMAYTQMFQSKLQRGVSNKSNKNKADADDDSMNHHHAVSLFAPIGSSPLNVARRLRKAGWGSVVATSLAKVNASTASASSSIFQQETANEPFDEHAALLLYAQSYVVACAFPVAASCCSSTSSSSALFRQVMAPWTLSTPTVQPFQPTKNLWIATIDRTQEATVKSLFVEGYTDLCMANKSVRKLVKGALKKDFVLTNTVLDDDEGIDFTSNFAKYYQNRGGCFLVAMDATAKTRQIVGFVTLCKVDSPPPLATAAASSPSSSINYDNNNNNNNMFFEIQRLFVVAEYRNKGVAGHLLDAVQQFGLAQSSSSSSSSPVPGGATTIVTFLVSTLNVLHAANRFYSHRGFIKLPNEVALDQKDGDGVTIYNYMLQIPKT